MSKAALNYFRASFVVSVPVTFFFFNLSRVIADLMAIPFVELSQRVIDKETLGVIPEIVARKNNIVAFLQDREGLHIATTNPENTQIKSFLEKKVGAKVLVHLATKRELDDAISLYSKNAEGVFDEIIKDTVSFLNSIRHSYFLPQYVKPNLQKEVL